ISNHYLDRVVVDGYVVVVIAAHTSHRPHRPRDFQPGNGWSTDRQKQPLNLRGQFNILQKLIALLAYCLVKQFSLFHISLNDVDHEGEPDQRGEVVCDPGPWTWIRIPEKIVEKDTDRDQPITNLAAQEHGTDPERQNVEIPQRGRRDDRVGVGNRSNRPEDQHRWQPLRAARGHLAQQRSRRKRRLSSRPHFRHHFNRWFLY